ncbi:MAG: CBS domain-containing protein [Rhizobiales bacterium]|nr:CBS domain-containing protein [Hyphomicrobiales bacterium]MBI3673864.1 CBS domain-containing protein [Hyphomicrobiales bacterium]
MAVAQILKQKGRTVVTVRPNQTLNEVAGILAQHRIGAVVVIDASGGIAGIVSERDVVKAIAAHGANALALAAREVMMVEVRTCSPRDTEAELMGWMTEHRIRHLPVIEDGKLAGMVSIGDVVKYRIETIEQESEQLKSYISSAG